MNRGSQRGRVQARIDPRGFNEAPIHESGKSRREVLAPRPLRGFNEAPIHESGKFSWFPRPRP